MWMIIFMLLPLLAIIYVGWHLWALLPLPSWARSLVIILGLGCFSLLFFSVARKFDTLPLSIAQLGYEVGTSSLIVLLYMVMFFLLADFGRLVHIIPRDSLHQNWQATTCLFIVLSGVFLYGNLHYRNKVRVTLDLQSSHPLPRRYKAVMLSDMHLGYHNTRSELSRWVDLINSESPDFILISGDIIDGSMRPLIEEGMTGEFRRLKAPIYACLGNHEYYAGEPAAERFYKDAGIQLLVDEGLTVDSAIVVIGRDDRTNPRRLPLDTLLSRFPQDKYTIVLDHQPYHLERTEKAGADFQFSGHTHRGQVWPISWITDAIYECSWGSYQRGRTHYYISSGLGIWGAKFRIGTQSEYVVATIHPPF